MSHLEKFLTALRELKKSTVEFETFRFSSGSYDKVCQRQRDAQARIDFLIISWPDNELGEEPITKNVEGSQ